MTTNLNWHVYPARRAARARRQWLRRGIGLLAATSVGFVAWSMIHFL